MILDVEAWQVELEEVLNTFPKWKNVIFSAWCCERQYGNYFSFYKEVGWGNPESLCVALDLLWNSGKFPSIRSIREAQRAIQVVTPDTEDFRSEYTSAALDAATSLLKALDYCVDGQIDHCLQIATLSRDTIYMFVQLRENLDYSAVSESLIYKNQLMMRELAMQQAEIECLCSLHLADESDISQLRKQRCNPNGGTLVDSGAGG